MADWSKDQFMSAWEQKYVSTNLKPGSRPYDEAFFLNLNSDLVTSQPDLKHISYTLIAAACCAAGRADIVGKFFDDLTRTSSPEESEQTFLRLREAITIIMPYLGMPSCVPACYGMIGVIQRKGQQFASTKVLRKKTISEEDVRKGYDLRAQIYKGVGNSEIFDLMEKYFTDLYTTSTVVTWGYLISKANEEVFQPQDSHLIVATAIMALGATRQTKSHIKATLGIGNSVQCVKTVVGVVTRIAEWADRPRLGPFDVDQLAVEIREALKQ
ncbi:hypothetical protein EDD36DRAFT_64943 [Exophiala viscosa]|uniref:Carboxymuconolactone decarboxylase-like domain-containing protein n=1 Tax=Exophiala viscosa TaxID=2486360 RepID=A0AAN6DSR3_9EURO|nr:hypothetical protein EDD36DRAFT_64943 [Exophiala viscosa]